MGGQEAQLDIEKHGGGKMLTVLGKSVNFGKSVNTETQLKKYLAVNKKARKAVYQAKSEAEIYKFADFNRKDN